MISTAQRHKALEQLGVQQWYSRKSLLGAAVSPIFSDLALDSEVAVGARGQVPVVESGKLLEPTDEVKVSAPNPVVPSTSQLLGDLEPPRQVKEAATPVVPDKPVSAPKPVVENKQAAVTLRRYLVDGVLVISESSGDFSALKEQALLKNILVACKLSSNSAQMLGLFNWPIFNTQSLPGLDEQMRDSLITRWLNDATLGNVKTCFLMGEGAYVCEALMDDSDIFIQKCSASLLAMISMPAKKASVWREIQPNLKQLHERAIR